MAHLQLLVNSMKGMILRLDCTLKLPGELLIFAMPRNQCPAQLNQNHWGWNLGNNIFRDPQMIPKHSQVLRTTHTWHSSKEYFHCWYCD